METAGIPENYAEVITAVISESRRHSDIATKGDLKEMRYEIHYEMKCLEQRMTIKAGVLGVAIFIISMINNRF
ncbi:hypothetical protein ICN28_05245 [Polynucleobacter sp. 30F-ANTBAC]|nr:hypothetical protein [Polynucleobacter sp. 30F-ANTBAC]